jgi:hypothetical protein
MAGECGHSVSARACCAKAGADASFAKKIMFVERAV